jgi:hypothetical protein
MLASVAAYLKAHLGRRTTIKPLATEGHLPHLDGLHLTTTADKGRRKKR